jgi:hypothetical protein
VFFFAQSEDVALFAAVAAVAGVDHKLENKNIRNAMTFSCGIE